MKKIIYLIATTVLITGQGIVTNAQQPANESEGGEVAEILCLEFVEEDTQIILDEVERMITVGKEFFALKDLDTLDYVAKQLKSGQQLKNLCSY